ncbi:Crp/Fnr family transcriptional regulator [Prolixibacteraceae bacterium Z1-6]|uniref:Crp/Fnr family transcriptional regulator n=1 Tax=Draconibacterium aestuarii TaxID=2998507 RepID=A0A9X3J5P3_9BACT|nr:Crp/Fnr family transcriptional regulator [Prolixibacteraceae bacterium Z1-6]
MNILGNSCVDCTLKSSEVSILDKTELCLLEEGCLKTSFQKGELIFKEGSPAQHITYVRDGFIKLVKKGIGGKDFILSISKKGTYLSLQNLNSDRKKNFFSAIAITPSEVCFIETECFAKLLKQNGAFASKVISTIINDEMNYFDRLVNNVQQQLPGRLANTLMYFKNEVYNQNPFNLNLTKTELAALIGTSRESVSRILKDFQDAGIILMEKSIITILDDQKMEEIKLKG